MTSSKRIPLLPLLIAVAISALAIAAPAHAAQSGARSQTFTIVNQAGVSTQTLSHIERAVAAQTRVLRRWWGTPLVRFGSGGWEIILVRDIHRRGFDGWHNNVMCANGDPALNHPYANVGVRERRWSVVLSHEVLEMLVDPAPCRGHRQPEICDPVERAHYIGAGGVLLSDFTLPAWFRHGARGPWDFLGRTHRAGDRRLAE